LPTDSFTVALARLDPASRALLDLSLRRGMRPEEISDLLATDPESVIVAREQALDHLAADLHIDREEQRDYLRARLAELPGEAWTPPKQPQAKRERPLSTPEPPAAEATDETRYRLPLMVGLLAVAIVALVIALSSSGDDKKPSPPPSQANPTAADKPPAAKPPTAKPQSQPSPTVRLAPVAGGGAVKGTAHLSDGGKRLQLRIDGLPRGSYQVWLYNSVIDSKSIGGARGGSRISLDAKLPADAAKYRYVDISRERADGNANHSGESVARVPLKKLAR
jgi:hypothetical protein